MSKSITTNQKELLNTQLNTEETPKQNSSDELIKYEDIKGTPFTLVYIPEQGYFLGMGKYRLSEWFEDKEKLKTWLHENMWNTIINMIHIVLENHENYQPDVDK